MSKRAFIYAAGAHTYEDVSLYSRIKRNEDDLIICADGGYNLICEAGIKPDVIIGDMDSVSGKLPTDVKIYTSPCKKDKTDLHICVDFALQHKCDQIILLGVMGGRISHSMGSLMMLEYIHKNHAAGMILTASTRVFLVSDKISVKRDNFKYLSLIPLTETAEGVSISGVKYPLENAVLKRENNLGISNEFAADTAEISVKKGLLTVVCEDMTAF